MLNHALFAPSSASRWLQCPRSALEAVGIVQEKSFASSDGSRLHELAEGVLRGEDIEMSALSEDDALILSPYFNYIAELPPGTTHIEYKVDLQNVLKDCWGTADIVHVEPNGHMHVIDLKTGRFPVKAANNLQLMCYALGAYYAFGGKEFTTVIVQPKLNRIEEESFDLDTLLMFEERLKRLNKIIESMKNGENIDYVPSKSACRFCLVGQNNLCPKKYVDKPSAK